MRKPTPGDVLFGFLVLWCLCATGLTARVAFASRSGPSDPTPQSVTVADWGKYATRGYAFGPAFAPVTITIFSDFQCPFCRRFGLVVDSLRRLDAQVRVIERHFPIPELHPAAYGAALAAECARSIGKYESMRTALFSNQSLAATQNWRAIAAKAGIQDTASIGNCVTTRQYASVVDDDIAAGKRLGVSGTPTILVNDQLLPGALGLASLKAEVRQAQGARGK